MKGFILYATYRTEGDEPVLHYYGVLEDGRSFLSLHAVRPYFYIKKADLKAALLQESFEYQEVDLTDFAGKGVVKVILSHPREVPELRRALEQEGIECYEADIRFALRFLIDQGIKGAVEIEGTPKEEDGLWVLDNPQIRPALFQPRLRVLSVDIETNYQTEEILSVALAQGETKTVLMVSEKAVKGAEAYPSEEALLEAFQEAVHALDPDVITGWNVVDFDLMTLFKRFRHYRMRVELGRQHAACKLRLEQKQQASLCQKTSRFDKNLL